MARTIRRDSARFPIRFDALRHEQRDGPVDVARRPNDFAVFRAAILARGLLSVLAVRAFSGLRRGALGAIAIGVALGACGRQEGDAGLRPLAQALTVHNPVQKDCADPSVMKDGGSWYLTCTGGHGTNHFPIYRSTDLLHWTRVGWVFTAATTPSWAKGDFWAPELHHVPGGIGVYFSALDHGKHVIGVAKAATVLGPYHARSTPLVSRPSSVIDAHVLVVGSKRWLYWKAEGSPDALYARQLSSDGMSLSHVHGRKILVADRAWEHGVVEGPWVQKRGGWYYLFYSGGAYCNATYAVGVARSRHPLGPFVKRGAPILTSGHHWVGPGHNSLTHGPDGKLYLVYHAYHLTEGTPVCGTATHDNNRRHTLIDRVTYVNGWPRVSSHL